MLGVFGPNVQRYFGMNDATFGLLVGVQVTALVLLAVPIGYLGTKIDRGRILRWSALAWSVMSFATTFAVTAAAVLPRPLRRRHRQVGRRAGRQVAAHRLLPAELVEPDPGHPRRGQPGRRPARPGAGLRHRLLRRRRRRHLALGVPRPHRARRSSRSSPPAASEEPENQMVRGLAGATLSVTGAPSGMNFREAVAPSARASRPSSARSSASACSASRLVGVVAFLNIFLERQYGIDADRPRRHRHDPRHGRRCSARWSAATSASASSPPRRPGPCASSALAIAGVLGAARLRRVPAHRVAVRARRLGRPVRPPGRHRPAVHRAVGHQPAPPAAAHVLAARADGRGHGRHRRRRDRRRHRRGHRHPVGPGQPSPPPASSAAC